MNTKKGLNILIYIFSLCVLFSLVQCNRGTGCPAEDAHVKVDKKGNPKSKPDSGLFDKKTRKKMGKG